MNGKRPGSRADFRAIDRSTYVRRLLLAASSAEAVEHGETVVVGARQGDPRVRRPAVAVEPQLVELRPTALLGELEGLERAPARDVESNPSAGVDADRANRVQRAVVRRILEDEEVRVGRVDVIQRRLATERRERVARPVTAGSTAPGLPAARRSPVGYCRFGSWVVSPLSTFTRRFCSWSEVIRRRSTDGLKSIPKESPAALDDARSLRLRLPHPLHVQRPADRRPSEHQPRPGSSRSGR